MKIVVADRYMTLKGVKPNKDCTQGCDIHNDYTCFECEDIQIRKKYPNAIYNDDCQWVINKAQTNRKKQTERVRNKPYYDLN